MWFYKEDCFVNGAEGDRDKTKLVAHSFADNIGFTHVGQDSLRIIIFKIELADLFTNALFHVIDVETSNNALLGQPTLHTSEIIALTLHQYLKYTNENGNENLCRRSKLR